MSGIAAIGTGRVDPVGPLPAGVAAPKTAEERSLYDACKGFEAVFVRQLVAGWMKSARGDDAAQGAQGVYQDMADEQMTSSMVESGSFGLAGTLYGQLAPTLPQAATP